MNQDAEIKHFQAIAWLCRIKRRHIGAQLQARRVRLIAAGLSDGQINDLIHDRQGRAAYQSRPASTETPLKVPFSDKDRAKALGARWSLNRKIWIAPAGSDLNKFKRWL